MHSSINHNCVCKSCGGINSNNKTVFSYHEYLRRQKKIAILILVLNTSIDSLHYRHSVTDYSITIIKK